MTQLPGNCPGCGGDEPFEQLHRAGELPGCPGGECPEWGCTVCGAAVFIGLPVREHVSRSAARPRNRTTEFLAVLGCSRTGHFA